MSEAVDEYSRARDSADIGRIDCPTHPDWWTSRCVVPSVAAGEGAKTDELPISLGNTSILSPSPSGDNEHDVT